MKYKKNILVCLLFFVFACSMSFVHKPEIKVKTRHNSFNLKKADNAKMAIMPIRDFSDHFGFAYSAATLDAFMNNIKIKFPDIRLLSPDETENTLEKAGLAQPYEMFVNRCTSDRNYCVAQDEIAEVFKGSNIKYVVSFTIGTLGIPIPGAAVVYYLSVVVYDVNMQGRIVYNALSEGELFADADETPGELLLGIMQQIGKDMAADF